MRAYNQAFKAVKDAIASARETIKTADKDARSELKASSGRRGRWQILCELSACHALLMLLLCHWPGSGWEGRGHARKRRRFRNEG